MKLNAFLSGLIIMSGLVACGPSTKIEKTWADPSVTPATFKPFKKILVVAQFNDESTRRIAEDKLAAQFPAGTAVQSYTYLTAEDNEKTKVEQRLKADGFDGVIVMSLTNVDKSTNYVPGSTYGGWYGYRYGSPGYYTEDKTYLVETSIYSYETQKLLWSGTTSTVNPTKVDKTINDILNAVKAELAKQGFTKK